jgi:hypothetical protein
MITHIVFIGKSFEDNKLLFLEMAAIVIKFLSSGDF